MQNDHRQLGGAWLYVTTTLAALLPVSGILYALNVFPEFGLLIFKEQFLAFFLMISLVLTFLLVPARKGKSMDRVPWYDRLLILASLASGLYVSIRFDDIVSLLGFLPLDIRICSMTVVALVFEATRRQTGWVMVCIGAGAVAYAYFGWLMPGILETRPLPFARLIVSVYMAEDASILSIPLFVAATIILAFFIFGQLLFKIGGGQAISDLAMAVMGRNRGGPAKVAVVASALFGSLSGSASANVATTGMVTIPMMRNAGYEDYKAAGIEAVASTGGLILPPVMAATAFIMAEFLGTTYASIAIAAALPALLYYFCVFLQVDFEAAKGNIKGLPRHQLPGWRSVAKRVWPLIIPAFVLVYALFGLFQRPEVAGLFAAAATLAISIAFKDMRLNIKRYLEILAETGVAVVYIAVITAVAGMVMGAIAISGLGNNMSRTLVEVSGGNVVLLLLLSAVASTILGMGRAGDRHIHHPRGARGAGIDRGRNLAPRRPSIRVLFRNPVVFDTAGLRLGVRCRGDRQIAADDDGDILRPACGHRLHHPIRFRVQPGPAPRRRRRLDRQRAHRVHSRRLHPGGVAQRLFSVETAGCRTIAGNRGGVGTAHIRHRGVAAVARRRHRGRWSVHRPPAQDDAPVHVDRGSLAAVHRRRIVPQRQIV